MNCDELRRILTRDKELNSVSLARIMGWSHTTAMNRLRHPDNFRLRELEKIMEKTGLSLSEIKEVIRD